MKRYLIYDYLLFNLTHRFIQKKCQGINDTNMKRIKNIDESN